MSGTKSLIRKYYDLGPTSVAASSVYTGGATGWTTGVADDLTNASTWITGITQGATDNDRLAISVSIESIDLRVQISPMQTVAGQYHLRMIMFADSELQGAAPASGDLLLTPTAATGAIISMLNPSYFGRFKIIEDKHWQWSIDSSGDLDLANTPSLYHETHHDMKNHICMWDTTNSSAIANARKGHIFLYWYFQAITVTGGGVPTLVTTNPPAIHFVTRCRFRDV